MVTKTDEQDLADFEAWFATKFNADRLLEKTSTDGYGDACALTAWLAYQAGRAALQSQDREDRLRLDWIERNARRDPDMNGNHTWWPTSFNKTIRGPSLREAIDHARRIEGEGK